MAVEQRYTAFEKAKNYTKEYELDKVDSIVTKQEDGYLGYISAGQFATTGSNIFEGGQIIDGNLTIAGDIFANAFNVTTTSIEHFTASTRFGLDSGDTHTFTGSVFITGSESLKGDLIVSGNVYVSGTTELGGNIVPKTARGATLGTSDRPFSEIFVSSGSINIASDTIGDPNTTLTNIGGNILVSAGGMRLVGDASFIAATGSFQYLSGSFTHIGSQFNEGDIVTTGSLAVSGSTIMIGNNTMLGNTSLTGSMTISGSTTQIGNNNLLGNTVLSGSVNISGSTDIQGATTIKGTLFVSGATNFQNHKITMTGSMFMSGSQIITGSLDIDGNLNIANGSGFYRWGNKLFNNGGFYDTRTQSGSANVSQSMMLNSTEYHEGIDIVSGSHIVLQNVGVYNLQFSTQIVDSGAGDSRIYIWIKKNGVNVPNSATKLFVQKDKEIVAAWNWFIQSTSPNDYYEIVWQSNDSDTQLIAEVASGNYPAIPSVIVTVSQVA